MTREITPMPAEEIAKLKAAIEKRWDEKPHYQGGDDPMGSPGCMMRAQEILALIAAVEAKTTPPPSSHEVPVAFIQEHKRQLGRVWLAKRGDPETDAWSAAFPVYRHPAPQPREEGSA